MRLFRSPGVLAATLGVCAILGLLIYGKVASTPDRSIDSAIASGARKAAPKTVLPALGRSGEVDLADYAGKVVVVNFWASWCEPCKEESPALERFWRSNRDKGVVVLGIDSMDVTSDAEAFVRRYRLTYPMARDDSGATRRSWGLTGFPETFIVDPNGKIAQAHRGPVDVARLDDLLKATATRSTGRRD